MKLRSENRLCTRFCSTGHPLSSVKDFFFLFFFCSLFSAQKFSFFLFERRKDGVFSTFASHLWATQFVFCSAFAVLNDFFYALAWFHNFFRVFLFSCLYLSSHSQRRYAARTRARLWITRWLRMPPLDPAEASPAQTPTVAQPAKTNKQTNRKGDTDGVAGVVDDIFPLFVCAFFFHP